MNMIVCNRLGAAAVWCYTGWAMALTEEQSLRQAIAREEASLVTLEQEQQENWERLATLKAELAAITPPISIPPTSVTQPIADIHTTLVRLCSAQGFCD